MTRQQRAPSPQQTPASQLLASQAAPQEPSMQRLPPGQKVPHIPQLVESMAGSEQRPAQHCCVTEHGGSQSPSPASEASPASFTVPPSVSPSRAASAHSHRSNQVHLHVEGSAHHDDGHASVEGRTSSGLRLQRRRRDGRNGRLGVLKGSAARGVLRSGGSPGERAGTQQPEPNESGHFSMRGHSARRVIIGPSGYKPGWVLAGPAQIETVSFPG